MPAPKDPEAYKLWRERLKKAKVGFVPWNKGRNYSEEPEFDEYRATLSEAQRGKPHPKMHGKKASDETRAKLSAAHKGKRIGFSDGNHKHSEETKAKMSASHAGKSVGPMPEEQRKKVSSGLKKAYEENPEMRERLIGHEVAEETRKKISDANKLFNATEEGKELIRQRAEAASERQTGKPLSDAHREAISKSNKEYFNRPEVREETSKRIAALYMNGFFPYGRAKHGYHDSPKTGDRHHYRSSYELKAYEILDADPNVALYITEPCAIPYTYCGEAHRYIPDLYVEFSDGSWALIEIKPGFQLEDEETQTKHLAASRVYDEHFMIWSEQELVQ